MTGITKEMQYLKDIPEIHGCVDAHIKTALARIFPNAEFKDKYRYGEN